MGCHFYYPFGGERSCVVADHSCLLVCVGWNFLSIQKTPVSKQLDKINYTFTFQIFKNVPDGSRTSHSSGSINRFANACRRNFFQVSSFCKWWRSLRAKTLLNPINGCCFPAGRSSGGSDPSDEAEARTSFPYNRKECTKFKTETSIISLL